MPISPAVLLTIQAIQALIAAAPGMIDIATKGKALIDSMFTSKLITADQQNALHALVDAQYELAKSGIVPPAWQVEPDPTV